MPKKNEPEVRYIGLSAQEFVHYASEDLKSFKESSRVDPKVYESYAKFVEAVRPHALRIRHYVFVFSRFIFIKIEF